MLWKAKELKRRLATMHQRSETGFAIFSDADSSNTSNVVVVGIFEAFSDYDGLPFPLYLKLGWRVLISLCLLAILVRGLHYRTIIFKYLWKRESSKPINLLILTDQLNSLLLGFGISVRIVSMLSPVPMSRAFGTGFCTWISLPVFVYTSGKVAWSCFLALMRVLYIKAQVCGSLNFPELKLKKSQIWDVKIEEEMFKTLAMLFGLSRPLFVHFCYF